MSEFRSIKIAKNAFWMIGVKVVQSAVAFIINLFTARYLGPSNYGLISYAASIVAFVVPIMQLGIPNVLVFDLVQNKDEEGAILGSALTLNVLSALFCIIGVIIFSMVANPGETETIIVCSLYSLLLVFKAAEVTNYWFQAKLLSKYPSIISFFVYLLVAVYKTFLLITQKNIFWFAISNAFDYFLVAVGLFIAYRKLGGQKISPSISIAKRLFYKGKYYIISSMMVTIFAQTDRIMLKHMLSTTDVGLYSAAANCAGITTFVFAALIDSFRPVIFESKEISKEKFEHNISLLYSIITYLCLLQCIFMVIFADPIVSIIYGKEYSSAVSSLRIIVWYITFSYYGSIRNIWLLAENKQKYLWIINLSGAVTNVILNFFLIPVIGVNGAAIASLSTQFFTNVVIGFIVRPIVRNNSLMLKGLNPKLIADVLSVLKNQIKTL